jgi:nucleoside-diphosphate-sugar epimerase
MSDRRVLFVTGSSGRIGRLLRLVWHDYPPPGLRVVWQVRRTPRTPDELLWDILTAPPPVEVRDALLLHLAGPTTRDPVLLADHQRLALAVAAAGFAHMLVVSSAAVYGPSARPHAEEELPAPQSPYGAAKLGVEQLLAGRKDVTLLRIGNVAGADALLGVDKDRVSLDPVPGQAGGPERSYIGPLTLARVLAQLCARAPDLPAVLNIAQAPSVAMADLLRASGRNWGFGPDNPTVLPRVDLATERLDALLPGLPEASADRLVAELVALRGTWP